MDTIEIAVVAGAVGAIVWVNWYFFWSGVKAASARTTASGVQEIEVTVLGGYEPAHIEVEAGRRVRLLFDRQETSSCSEEVVFPDFGIRRFLPAFETTPVEFTADEPGDFDFTCGMGMLRGRLIVRGG